MIETGTEERIIINSELYPRMNIAAELIVSLFEDKEFDVNDSRRFKEQVYYHDHDDPKYASRRNSFSKSIRKVLKQVMLNELYGTPVEEINRLFNENGFTLIHNRELPSFKK